MSQLIQFDGYTVAVIDPEELENMEAELSNLRADNEARKARIAELEQQLAQAQTNTKRFEKVINIYFGRGIGAYTIIGYCDNAAEFTEAIDTAIAAKGEG